MLKFSYNFYSEVLLIFSDVSKFESGVVSSLVVRMVEAAWWRRMSSQRIVLVWTRLSNYDAEFAEMYHKG